MLIRAIVDTNLGLVIAICDDDDQILLFDDEDAGGPASTIPKPEDLEITDLSALTHFLIQWLKGYDDKVVIESVVIEALFGGVELPAND